MLLLAILIAFIIVTYNCACIICWIGVNLSKHKTPTLVTTETQTEPYTSIIVISNPDGTYTTGQ